jgi:hypothetical protein
MPAGDEATMPAVLTGDQLRPRGRPQTNEFVERVQPTILLTGVVRSQLRDRRRSRSTKAP